MEPMGMGIEGDLLGFDGLLMEIHEIQWDSKGVHGIF